MSQTSGLANPLAVAEGGTGATSAEDAKDNLGLLDFAVTANDTPPAEGIAINLQDINTPRVYTALDVTGFLAITIAKDTTGDPTGVEGAWCVNTADNTLKFYGGGAWRAVASW